MIQLLHAINPMFKAADKFDGSHELHTNFLLLCLLVIQFLAHYH